MFENTTKIKALAVVDSFYSGFWSFQTFAHDYHFHDILHLNFQGFAENLGS